MKRKKDRSGKVALVATGAVTLLVGASVLSLYSLAGGAKEAPTAVSASGSESISVGKLLTRMGENDQDVVVVEAPTLAAEQNSDVIIGDGFDAASSDVEWTAKESVKADSYREAAAKAAAAGPAAELTLDFGVVDTAFEEVGPEAEEPIAASVTRSVKAAAEPEISEAKAEEPGKEPASDDTPDYGYISPEQYDIDGTIYSGDADYDIQYDWTDKPAYLMDYSEPAVSYEDPNTEVVDTTEDDSSWYEDEGDWYDPGYDVSYDILMDDTPAPEADQAFDTFWNDDPSLTRTLSNGSAGNDVLALQMLLAERGYFNDTPSGIFGDATQTAVLGYQLDHGLTPDGIAGAATFRALSGFDNSFDYAAPQESFDEVDYDAADGFGYDSTEEAADEEVSDTYWNDDSSFTRTLSSGSAGNDVIALQLLLAENGYFFEDATGIFGDATQTAVVGYQLDHGLTPDGVAGSATFAALTGVDSTPVYDNTDTYTDDSYDDNDWYDDSYEEPAYVEPTYSSLGQQIVDYAMGFVGVTPYVWAGRSLYSGTDCSGFVSLIFGEFGIYCSPASAMYDGSSFGYIVSSAEARPGDIAVYGGGSHVAIYAGDGMVVHCSSPENGTVYWGMNYRSDFSWFLRVVD